MRVNTQITPQEFRNLELPDHRDWELHEGEIVEITSPSWTHRQIQDRLVKWLEAALPASEYSVLAEMPFEPGLNDRSADVGVVRAERDRTAEAAGVLKGAPEMVIEVWSRTSRKSEMADYRKLCFEHGTTVFWLVRPEHRTVSVTRRAEPGRTVTFESGDSIPLAPHSGEQILVKEIFTRIV